MLAASMTLVGSYVALSKPLVAAVPLFALAFLRFAIAAVAMLPWTLPRADEAPLAPRERLLLFAMSFLGNFLFSICMLAGVSLSTATAAGVIMATLPATVAAGSRLFLGEHLSGRALAAIALAVVGIVLLQFARPADDAAGVDVDDGGGGFADQRRKAQRHFRLVPRHPVFGPRGRKRRGQGADDKDQKRFHGRSLLRICARNVIGAKGISRGSDGRATAATAWPA